MKGTQKMWIERMEALGESLGLSVAVDTNWANTGVVRFRRPDSFSTLVAVSYGFQDTYASFDVRGGDDKQLIPTAYGVGHCPYEPNPGRDVDSPFEDEVQRVEDKVRELAGAPFPEFPFLIFDDDGVLERVHTKAEAIEYIREQPGARYRYERSDPFRQPPPTVTFDDLGARVTMDGVEVYVARNDDGEVTVGISTDKQYEASGKEWPHLYAWLNDATLHAPEGEPRDVVDAGPETMRRIAEALGRINGAAEPGSEEDAATGAAYHAVCTALGVLQRQSAA